MKTIKFNRTVLSTYLCICLLSSCALLPGSGPSARKINNLNHQQANHTVPEVALIELNEPVVIELYQRQHEQSFARWGEGHATADTVSAGDILEITIWEAPPAVLFGGALTAVGSGNAQVTKLPEQIINSRGTISVPFIGNVSVAGKTPLQIQEMIKGRLQKMANQPQVLVRLVQNHTANVSVIRPGNSIRMPLTAAGERVLDAVAAVGGSTANVQDTNIQLTRDNQVQTVALEDLVANPRQNILLRRGDVVTLITNPHTFTAMGAVGRTQEIGFSVKGLSLAEAIGRMGGLNDRQANPRGVFVFRYLPVADLPSAKQSRWLDKGYGSEAKIPVVYRLNLADANSLFWMQRFPIRNKDVVYVSNAPLTEMNKFLQFVFSPITGSFYDIDRIINY